MTSTVHLPYFRQTLGHMDGLPTIRQSAHSDCSQVDDNLEVNRFRKHYAGVQVSNSQMAILQDIEFLDKGRGQVITIAPPPQVSTTLNLQQGNHGILLGGWNLHLKFYRLFVTVGEMG